jgi:hypothetical protein
MTPSQFKMARHALGLDENGVSYRNRYTVGIGSPQEAEWNDLCEQGLAERGKNGLTFVGFWLTAAGAKAVVHPHERLDREDFPAVALQDRGGAA